VEFAQRAESRFAARSGVRVNSRFGLVFAALAASSSAACGGGGSTSLNDAGPDAEDAHHRLQDAGHDSNDARPDVVEVGATCDSVELGRGCVSGPCRVTGPASALPPGATVTVTKKPVPSNLTADALGPSLCSLTVAGVSSAGDLTLSIEETSPPSTAVLFEYLSASVATLVATSQPAATLVEGLVSAPGVYGATERSSGWTPQGFAGTDVSASGSQAELLRNLSGQEMYGAFYDGTRLFACNGPRLLIYNELPKSPSVLPDTVIGQPDVDTFELQTSSSFFGSIECRGIWSDWSSPGFVDIPGSVIRPRGVTYGKTKATQVYPGVQG
jgi:hypothetical protein